MGRYLSLDLRDRVIAAIEGGMSCRQAAERFGVSAASAIRWRQLALVHGPPLHSRNSTKGGDQPTTLLSAIAETRSSQRPIAATMWRCSFSLSTRPAGIPCHFARHARQHVAVACCAINTGCPRIGVCLPSLGGSAGASRFATKSAACSSITAMPRWSR